jgi:hypothetical protein
VGTKKSLSTTKRKVVRSAKTKRRRDIGRRRKSAMNRTGRTESRNSGEKLPNELVLLIDCKASSVIRGCNYESISGWP